MWLRKKIDTMKSLNVFAPINPLGYGVAGKNCSIMLNKFFDVSLFPIGQHTFDNQREFSLLNPLIQNSTKFDSKAPCLKIWHEFAMGERVGSGELIGYCFFELDQMNDVKKHHLKQCDKVVVTSQWAKEIVEKETGHNDVHVVPLGVDHTIFYPAIRQRDRKFVVFNAGKWEKRKGHDALLSIFNRAFPENNDVELWMMCSNPVASKDYNDKWESYYRTDGRVRILDRVKTQEELSDIMRSTTCGLFPSRGEGWNLELLEMMSCGKPVVTTYYSSHTEFCNQNNSIAIEPNSLEKAVDGVYFKEGDVGDWASLDDMIDEFAIALREIYSLWIQEEDTTNYAGIETAQSYNWLNTASKIAEVIDA